MADYSKIDTKRRATFKQILAVSHKFNEILQAQLNIPEDAPVTARRLFGRIKNSIIKMADGELTHGDIQKYFAMTALPADLLDAVKTDDLAELLKADGHKPKALKATAAKAKKSRGKKKKAVSAKVTTGKGLSEDQKADLIAKHQEQIDALTAS